MFLLKEYSFYWSKHIFFFFFIYPVCYLLSIFILVHYFFPFFLSIFLLSVSTFYYWLIILCNFCIYSKYFVNFQLYLHWWFQSVVFEFLLFFVFFSYLLIWLFLVLLNYFLVHVFLLFLLNYFIYISWISFKLF